MVDIINNEPHIVRVKDFRIDADYAAWLTEIKRRYHSAQIKAAVKVNTEKLAFNWSVGRDLVIRKAEETWGSGVVELSLALTCRRLSLTTKDLEVATFGI